MRTENTMRSRSRTLLSPEVWSRKAPASVAVLTASWMTTLPVIVALTVSDCCSEAAKDTGPVSISNFEFGFRYDPMKWLKSDRTLQGALVRTRVLGDPTDRDREILEKKIKAILTDQKPDGALSDHILHAVTQTGGRIRELIELGASPDRPELKNALAYVLKHGGKDKGEKQVGLGMARSLNLMGAAEKSAVKNAVKQKIDRAGKWNHIWAGCPWTPSSQLKQVWDVRVFDDRSLGVIMKGLKEIEGKLNSAGCADFNDPWGYLDVAGHVDLPLGRKIVEKQIPMILRSQRSDGGWGNHSLKVFRALKRYGMLDGLRERPPLPPDFRISRSIPAPEGDLFSMTWGDGKLWVFDKKANEAVALSPSDGKVVKKLKLPMANVRGIGWWDGSLAATQQNPKQKTWINNADARRLFRLHPDTGKVTGEFPLPGMHNIWSVTQTKGEMVVADGFLNAVGLFRLPDLKKRRVRVLGAPGTIHLATEDGVVWHTDWLLTNIIFKSEPNGKLLDWGTAPFEGGVGDWEDQMAVMGLAYDGKSLWALNNKTRRICLMEKTPAGRKVTESFARQREIDTKLRPIIMSLRCPGPVELPRDGQALTFENTVRNPFRSALEIRYAWDKLGSTWSMKPAEGTVKIAPGGKAVIRTSATLDRSRTVPLPVRTTTILIGGAKVREVDHRPVPPILRRLGTATRVRESPKVDGIIGNGEYGSAKPNANFRYFKGDGKAAHDTSFRLACDDRALYVGIVVNEPRPDGVEGEPRKRDGDVWRDDDIELFVDATFDRSTYHQFALGLKHNVQFDCIGGPRHGNFGDIKWNGEWQSATKVGNGAVAIELAIPYKTLGVGPPRTGDKWGLNLCRNRVGKGKKDGKSEMSAWCITYKGFHVPSHFGTVTFE